MKSCWFSLARRPLVALAVLALSLSSLEAATQWRIEPAHSRIAFGIDAVGYPRTTGVFRKFDGRIDIDFMRPELSRVVFHVDANSVDAGSPSFNDYLRSDGYLDTARHPEIDFVSRTVKKLNEQMVRVEGDLMLLGVTRPLAVDVSVLRDPSARGRVGFQAHARINRLEFGMNAGFPLISGDIDLDIATEAVTL